MESPNHNDKNYYFLGGIMKKRILFLTMLLLAAMVFTSVLLAESTPVVHIVQGENAGGGCFATGTAQGGGIPDNTPAGTCFTASVTGPAGATVNDVTVDVVATHSWIGDLIFTVQSPDATNLTLMDRPGLPVVSATFGDNDDLIATSPISFTDASVNPAEEMGDGTNVGNSVVCQSDGVCDFAPDDAFSTLAGENALGDWDFCVSDSAGGDTGSITSVTFNVACTGGDPPAPSLAFTKTVGTDPGVCATTDSINIPAGGGGTDVTYCYYMQNTGNVTFGLHTVTDDQLGTLLGPGFPAAVGPGGAAWFTVTTNITGTVVNSATWSATDAAGGNAASGSDTATVTQNAPTDVSLSSFGSDQAALSPVWLASLLAIILGFGFVLRRKMANN
jgi:subtilisin-like proprotein convertase family protein